MNFNEEERSIIANGLMNGSDIIDEYASSDAIATVPSSTSIQQQTTALPTSNSRQAASLIYSRMQQHQAHERAELEDLSRVELEEELNEADLIASVSAAASTTRRPNYDIGRSIADGLMNHHSSSEDLSSIEQQFIQDQQSHSQEDYGSRDVGSPEVMGGGAGGALYLPPLPP